jgi:8-oxo-dGTP pyrophosphatase MutT (NUDIX family)
MNHMVRVESIEPIAIKVKIDRAPMVHPQSEQIEIAWQALCDQNPRYFNGKMLAFERYDPSTDVIHARVEQYKHHAVRDSIDLGISLLAVTAILCAPDFVQKEPVYLLGKRSNELHRYGGLWEFGPSGGVDVPVLGNTLNLKKIAGEVAREIKEEIGVKISSRPHAPRALVHDELVGSTDIAIAVVLDHAPSIKTNWEYTETKWMTLDAIYQWTQTCPDDLIPTTIELAKHLHETRD